ncbi:hypothetical protein GGTG_11625 [Gaeumannomyces tritici R3-111a-1]|uniref:Uncharacterized protein n=1 Tax=Gaeumannomyces tritici (strain R3-111a-1) TaxID=644352 RepID=J3PDQ2_GAET3|nr:hypothetical protein GGTG_11625 [Gaeumannomyces tritici R3-111a-1]EJT70602.1 hypothetical protein GGTG_11625 [Gaeumannomyces tritici R3-111a-1]
MNTTPGPPAWHGHGHGHGYGGMAGAGFWPHSTKSRTTHSTLLELLELLESSHQIPSLTGAGLWTGLGPKSPAAAPG